MACLGFLWLGFSSRGLAWLDSVWLGFAWLSLAWLALLWHCPINLSHSLPGSWIPQVWYAHNFERLIVELSQHRIEIFQKSFKIRPEGNPERDPKPGRTQAAAESPWTSISGAFWVPFGVSKLIPKALFCEHFSAWPSEAISHGFEVPFGFVLESPSEAPTQEGES